jgi:hypothetical protein
LNKSKAVVDDVVSGQQIRSSSVGFSNNLTTTAQTKQSSEATVPIGGLQ